MNSALLSIFIVSTAAGAATNQEIIDACWDKGAAKMRGLAQEMECTLGAIRVESVRNHFWSPTKYVYFMSPSLCGDAPYTIRFRATYIEGLCN